MIIKNCETCAKKFTTPPSRIKEGRGRFCSRKCCDESLKTRLLGKNNPFWNGGDVEIECIICSKIFLVGKTRKYTAKCCSAKCRGKYVSPKLSGKKHYNWKGGKFKDKSGYIMIQSPNHPNRNKDNCVQEHRLVMEKHIGRFLNPIEVIHHINKIKYDNRIENLMLFTNNIEHLKYHRNQTPPIKAAPN